MILTAITIGLIVKAAAAAIGTAAAITVVFLNITQIIEWFKARRTSIPEVEKTKIYFTMLDLLATGDYKTVQGVFDTRTRQLGNSVRSIRSSTIDARLAGYHRDHRLAVYE
jgi:hypothetical protein